MTEFYAFAMLSLCFSSFAWVLPGERIISRWCFISLLPRKALMEG
jgi:hypothetical protein